MFHSDLVQTRACTHAFPVCGDAQKSYQESLSNAMDSIIEEKTEMELLVGSDINFHHWKEGCCFERQVVWAIQS